MSHEDPVCSECGVRLENKDWVNRTKRNIKGERVVRRIEIRRCPCCKKSHRLLPNDQSPFKHYETDVIEKVVDDDYGLSEEEAEALEDGPCEATKERWRAWAAALVKNAEGALRSAAYRVLDLPDSFLGSTESLLREIKRWRPIGWLMRTVEIAIEIGGLGLLPRSP